MSKSIILITNFH